MATLARRIIWQLRRDERGAIGVLVAVLLAGGVLTGMGALVVDIGQLYQVRAEQQNGADAGALGVAKSCALGLCDPSVAAGYANANASSADRRLGRSEPGLRFGGRPARLSGRHGRPDRLPGVRWSPTSWTSIPPRTRPAAPRCFLPFSRAACWATPAIRGATSWRAARRRGAPPRRRRPSPWRSRPANGTRLRSRAHRSRRPHLSARSAARSVL